MSEKIIFDINALLNGVKLTFGSTSNAGVLPTLQLFFNKLIDTRLKDVNEDKFYTLFSLHISSTSEPCKEHQPGGPHRRGLAIDISAVNGKSIARNYDYDLEVMGICNALQFKAIEIPETWENFGPLACYKTYPSGILPILPTSDGNKNVINTHKGHLHFSIRG